MIEYMTPREDTRTDVLRSMISRRITADDLPTLTRELANVVVILSSDVVWLLTRMRGDNGDGEGLIEQVQTVSRDVKTILDRLAALTVETKQATVTPFTKFVNWTTDKILPSLVTALIFLAIGLAFAAYLHLKVVQEVP